MNSVSKKRVLLLLCQGTEIFEASAFIDVMGWANDVGSTRIELVSVAMKPQVVTCTFGARMIADRPVSEISVTDFDALAIPGGFETFGFYEDAYSTEIQNLIREFGALQRPIGAICVGALPLAKTGLLSGRRATTYHLGEGRRRGQLSELGALVVDGHVVQDGPYITSSSPGTAVEVALRLLAAMTNEANAQHVRYLMGFSGTAAA
jgi:4-methyl-5(b-hydroxyethyl)-thiazole monophosphate biosynthesis